MNLVDAFKKFEDNRDNGKCPFCNERLEGVRGEFKDDLSWKEYLISGLCQSCQDKMFEDEED